MKERKEIEKEIKDLFDQWVELKGGEKRTKLRYAGPVFGKKEYRAMLDAVFDDWWSGGKHTLEAEKKLAAMSDRNHGMLTNSGSSANLLLVSAAKELYFNDGDKILTLSCGFPTTVNPIISSRLEPVFVDIDIDTLNLSPDTLEHALKHDKGIKGVFVAHTLGFPAEVDELVDTCRRHGVQIFFDCCDAYGTRYKNRPLQAYGKAASFSFYVAHHVSMGEGGGIVTNDAELFTTMRSMRNWGRYCASPNCCIRSQHPDAFCPLNKMTKTDDLPSDYSVNYQYEYLGYNLKPLDLQAAILSQQLGRLEEFTDFRRKAYDILYKHCQTLPVKLTTWPLEEGVSPFAFPMLLPTDVPFNRKHFVDFMARNQIETRMLFGGNLTKHPAYSKKREYWTSLGDPHVNADNIMHNFVMLGVSPVLNEKDVRHMCDKIDEFLSQWRIK